MQKHQIRIMMRPKLCKIRARVPVSLPLFLCLFWTIGSMITTVRCLRLVLFVAASYWCCWWCYCWWWRWSWWSCGDQRIKMRCCWLPWCWWCEWWWWAQMYPNHACAPWACASWDAARGTLWESTVDAQWTLSGRSVDAAVDAQWTLSFYEVFAFRQEKQ